MIASAADFAAVLKESAEKNVSFRFSKQKGMAGP
jgi:hypothetical protein